MDIIALLSQEFDVNRPIAERIVELIDEGNTIPFIARYRKEQTGAMDDQKLREMNDRLEYLRSLDKRREQIENAIEEQGKMTDELRAQIQQAQTLAALEDIYRPYKPKRRTRATIAKEKGLEPLALQIFSQAKDLPAAEELAQDYVNPDLNVASVEEALAGASDIIAEMISDDAAIRKALRGLMQKAAVLRSVAAKGKEEETSVYQLYYDFSQPLSKVQGHQVLAINRGEREDFLKVSVVVDREQALIMIVCGHINAHHKLLHTLCSVISSELPLLRAEFFLGGQRLIQLALCIEQTTQYPEQPFARERGQVIEQ